MEQETRAALTGKTWLTWGAGAEGDTFQKKGLLVTKEGVKAWEDKITGIHYSCDREMDRYNICTKWGVIFSPWRHGGGGGGGGAGFPQSECPEMTGQKLQTYSDLAS